MAVSKRICLRPLRRIEMGAPPDPVPGPASANRQTLREILAARMDGIIEFGRTCTGFEHDPGGVTIQFSDGSSAAADILAGADGIDSPVRRRYLPPALAEDTGLVCLYGRTLLTGQIRPLLPAAVRDGFTAVLGGSIGAGYCAGCGRPCPRLGDT